MAGIKFIGNHAPSRLANGRPSVNPYYPPAMGFGYMVARGQANGEDIISSGGLRVTMGALNMGVFFQTDVPVTLSFTLSPEIESDDAVWGSVMTVSPSDIEHVSFAFTGIKIVFGGVGGSLCIGTL